MIAHILSDHIDRPVRAVFARLKQIGVLPPRLGEKAGPELLAEK